MGTLATEHLLPAVGDDIELVPGHVHGEYGRGRVTDGEPLTVVGDPVAVRHLDPGGGAIPGEHHIGGAVGAAQVGQLAVIGLDNLDIVELQLLDHIGYPAFTKGFPGKHLDLAGPEQRPQRHLHGTGVGRWYHTHPVTLRQTEDLGGAGAGLAEQVLADRRPVGTPEAAGVEGGEVVARTLAAGAGGKIGIGRLDGRFHRGLGCWAVGAWRKSRQFYWPMATK